MSDNYITFTINEPKTTIDLHPPIEDVENVQVLDFIIEQKTFLKFRENQILTYDGKFHINIGSGIYTLDTIKKTIDSFEIGISIIKSFGNWFIYTNKPTSLSKGLSTRLCVPENLEANKPYFFIYKINSKFLVYSNLVDSQNSYTKINKGFHRQNY